MRLGLGCSLVLPRGGDVYVPAHVRDYAQTPGAATLPEGMVFSRASTEYVRADSGGSIAYLGSTVAADAPAVVTVGGVTGLLVEGAFTNDFGSKSRGSAFKTAPWTAGNVEPTLSYGPGVDGAAGQATRFNVASGGYPTAYSRYFADTFVAGATYTVGGHFRPTASNGRAEIRWASSSVFFAAGGTLPAGAWSRLDRTATTLATGAQFVPVDTGDWTAYGGVAAGASDLLCDMVYRYREIRSPISWHDTTHAGARLRVSDPATAIGRGRLSIEVVVALPYAYGAMRWTSRFWTLAGSRDTFAEIDSVKRRVRVSVHGVEQVFPVQITWSVTDVLRFRVACGNGRPTATVEVSADGGATFAAPTSLGTTMAAQPPIQHEGLPVDVLCDGTSKQLESVVLSHRFSVLSGALPGRTIYVSTTGTGSGTFAAPASLSAGLTAARAHIAAGAPARIVMRGGTYFLATQLGGPLALNSATDNGLMIMAYPGEVPDLSGAVPVTGWSLDSGAVYKATVPSGYLPARHISVAIPGATPVRAKTAISTITLAGIAGWARTSGGWTAPSAVIAGYSNPLDVRIHGGSAAGWKAYYEPVTAAVGTAITVDSSARDAASFQYSAALGFDFRVSTVRAWEGGREQIAAAGDFAFNSTTSTVYYYPRAGEVMASADARIPVLESLLTITGTADAPATGIQILGLTFSDTNAKDPMVYGWSPLQDGVQVRGTEFVSETVSPPMSAAVVLTYAHGCTIGGGSLTRLGGSGLRLWDGCADNIITGVSFLDISGGGAHMGWVLQDNQRPGDARKKVSRNTFRSCTVDTYGVHYWGAVAISAFFVDHCVFDRLSVANGHYSGICVGWGWGYAEGGGHMGHGWPTDLPPASGDTVCGNNTVSNCLVGSVNDYLPDGGAVYLVGRQPGTVVTECVHSGLNGHGVYLDNACSLVEVVNCACNASLAIQSGTPQATANDVRDSFFAGSPVTPGSSGVHASNVVAGCTFDWHYAAPGGAASIVQAAGR